jgi:hypothetical protein
MSMPAWVGRRAALVCALALGAPALFGCGADSAASAIRSGVDAGPDGALPDASDDALDGSNDALDADASGDASLDASGDASLDASGDASLGASGDASLDASEDGGPPPCTPLPTGAGYYAMASSPYPMDLHAALQWAESQRVGDNLAKATLTIASGTYLIGGFVNQIDPYGTPLAAVVAPTHISIQGAGRDCTVFKLDASATWTTTVIASGVNAGATPNYATNKYAVLRITDNGSGNEYNDFTLDCSRMSGSWPHEFNGIEVRYSTASQMNRVKVIGVPGSKNIPPHETFHINYYHCSTFVTSDVELDGDHVGASGFAPNNCTSMTFDNVWAHDKSASHGLANYNSTGTTVNNGLFENNGTGVGDEGGVGINCEGSLGTFTFNGCTSRGNTLSATRIYADTNSIDAGGANTNYIYKDCVLHAGQSGVAIRYDGLQANGGGKAAELVGTTAANVIGTTTNNP